MFDASPLTDLRDDLADPAMVPDAIARTAIVSRLDDIIAAISGADRALDKLPRADIAEAARLTANAYYIGGRSWRRQLAESDIPAATLMAVHEESTRAIEPMVRELERLLVAANHTTIRRDGELEFVITCAVCGGEAVTFSRARAHTDSPIQLVVSSLSPVTVFRPIAGPRMKDLVSLLERGNAGAVIAHLKETQPGGCDAHCPTCDRVYCRTHYAVEAQWSGSWHEATHATCPVGHDHEVD
ncbi:MAG: hypothetical protein FJ202_05440 [Gemmatimonadetes bacterium]|nr:hypothetical protein [Gemmatimonadota bacterium]